jgi:hypothetical protein
VVGDEVPDGLDDVGGGLLGHEVPAGDGRVPQVGRPGAPPRGGVEAESRAPVLLENGHGHPQPAPGSTVGPVVLDVDAGRGAVVGDDGGDGRARSRQVGGADLVRDRPRVPRPDVEEMTEEDVRGGVDHPLGQTRRLGHQVEVEADGRAGAVHHVPHVQRGQHVERGEMGDRLGVVEARADGDQRAPVVPRQGETLVAQSAGERDDVGGHGALGVRVPVGAGVDGLVAGAVAPQVGTDDGVVGREVGGHVPPHQVRLRESVQQHDRAAGSGDGDVERDMVGDGDPPVVEAGDGRCHGSPFLGGGSGR